MALRGPQPAPSTRRLSGLQSTETSSIAGLERWYAERGSTDTTYERSIGQPLPALPIAGHQCGVDACVGYVRNGRLCADHIPRSAS